MTAIIHTVAGLRDLPLFRSLPAYGGGRAGLLVRSVLVVMLLLPAPLRSSAQEYLCRWLSMPDAGDTAAVWFRHTYTTHGYPRKAWLTVMTTGRFDLYVNGRNVSLDILMPLRTPYDTTAVASTFDVTRFFRPDTNVVCIAYSPTFPRHDHRQVSVTLYGDDAKGRPFVLQGDGDWLCRPADGGLTADGGEWHDATRCPWPWTDSDFDLACWRPAHVGEPAEDEPVRFLPPSYSGERVVRVRPPRYFDVAGDSVVYDFGKGFYGIVRVTLRDARRGGRIRIGGLEYVCSGDIDEQAFRRYTATGQRRVVITGDGSFRREQIQSVEALEVGLAEVPLRFR